MHDTHYTIRAQYLSMVLMILIPHGVSLSHILVSFTMKPVYNDHLYNELYYLWFIQ